MAAPANMAGAAEDSSSSDDEQLKRCQEAVWDCRVVKTDDASNNNKKPSKRLVVADHEHDGNELQVTQGFQTHVAKKLGLILDSLISEKQSSALPSLDPEKLDNKDEDTGFRLFSTSVPGQENEEPPPPKRRPIPSSSDSDDEMEARLKEAAVSIKDLLPLLTSPIPNNSAGETLASETTEPVKRKKKKKMKRKKEEDDQMHSTNDIRQKSVQQEEAETTARLKKKKKKRKDTLENSKGQVLS